MRRFLNVLLISREDVGKWWGLGRESGGFKWAGLAWVILGAVLLSMTIGASYADDAPASGGSGGSNYCVDGGDEIP